MEIFQALRKDHEKQRLLMKILVETSGDTETRRAYFSELKEQLSQHAVAEERHFYSPLMESDKTIEDSRHGIAEHHEIDELVEKLDNTEMSSSAWLHHMKSLQDLVLHHLDEEESEFFQHANKVLSHKQQDQLANDYQKEMQQA
ncbi:hemerythrin domain-containing protein [Paraglaciecola arctica]|uniref:hemerythrin domain-containing protein n=1 Tax=Paraglaciecola arctica TaxID=1128911 RepID=UPI001C06F947|nr:hemerythrin domain-containing protein [Paraglaciecola arctica]MBU3005648.1 hemerythrin domain-containing protein [Paraglaciecola arctica]